jgi:acyl carrier protein
VERILDAADLRDIFWQVAAELQIEIGDAGPDTPLKALGVDSLAQFELLTAIEDQVELRIPDQKIDEIKTINDVIQCFLDMQRERAGLAADHEAGQ